MQIDRRFADYALTGGFFLIGHMGMLWAAGYWPTIRDGLQGLGLEPNTLLTPIVTGFAGALAVIAVFVVGLILDLSASVFRGEEMKIFARHLDHNSEWMTSFIEAHKAYCGADYETFRRVIRELPTPRAGQIFTSKFWKPEEFKFWKPEKLRRDFEATKVAWGFGIASEYERLLSFFTSYIGQSGSAQLTLMADQYSLWRTARAIAMALWLLAIEAVLVSNIFGLVAAAAIILPIPWIVFGLTIFIIRGPYSRMCFTLFSLLYMTCEKQIVPRTNADRAP
ncbi:hypothetical protein [Bradyrhizobium sp. Arg816]|uniref:hypothetical protein n=1 Tax=Bradyrhizobium sp. Arg816 TaxID=2998491 RepID=UPI00249E21B7|nr:hypothetical protein [Bradyrhizobium sp. Arg816]MDI3562450.1 hypothetical protein [Bradyrhizobium sp. Arg816]